MRILPALFWLIIAVMSAGFTFTGWQADNWLSRQFLPVAFQTSSQSDTSSGVRTLSFETRRNQGEGLIDESHTVITGSRVEAFNFNSRLPSFYRLKIQSKVSKHYQCRILKLPNSPMAMNQILRI
jgi:hypothetical protein